jgi:hypothetical protein
MTKLTKNELLEALAQYGYELNKPSHHYNGEEVLLNLLKEDDTRLLEGFPVAYDNILNNQKHLNLDVHGLSEKEKTKLLYLFLLTYALLKLFGEDKSKLNETENTLSKLSKKWKVQLKDVEDKFNHSDSVRVNGVALSTDRLKKQFRNYVVHFGARNENEPKMDMELELLLSEFFTSKQKDLLKKRARREELSKTEREYYSRVVNKRLKALANEHLYQFAHSIVK